MILDLDIGNSRIKWLLRSSATIVDRGVSDSAVEVLQYLGGRDLRPRRIRGSCVGAQAQLQTLQQGLAESGLPACEMARSSALAAGVSCGYERFEQLGVDRWLAVCAAWACIGGPNVVVDAGTTLTVDFTAGDGRHLGGYIVPGLRLQQRALLVETEQVRFQVDEALQSIAAGRNTADAVGHGIVLMLCAMIDRSLDQFASEHGVATRLVLTGGDACVLGQYLRSPYRHEPDLVLQGINLLMADD